MATLTKCLGELDVKTCAPAVVPAAPGAPAPAPVTTWTYNPKCCMYFGVMDTPTTYTAAQTTAINTLKA